MGRHSPSEIEIYGLCAAGGVILITTKKGVGNQTTVNYDGYMSVDVLANKPNLLNADQWRLMILDYSQQLLEMNQRFLNSF